MTHTLFATYDGKQSLVIEKPLHLPPNTRVKIIVELEEGPGDRETEVEPNLFGFVLSRSQHTGITDWAENHDHYLYGVPKRNET